MNKMSAIAAKSKAPPFAFKKKGKKKTKPKARRDPAADKSLVQDLLK